MSAQVAADLRAAAEVLRRDGWRNDGKALARDNRRRCVLQAVQFVCTGSDDSSALVGEAVDRYRTAKGAFEAHVGVRGAFPLHAWNDAPGRTADEVIAALEAAADAAEADQ